MKEVRFVRHFWCFLLTGVSMPCTPLFENNEGTVQLVKNPITNCNSKHIDLRYRLRRELASRKEMSLIRVLSACLHVDFTTKVIAQDSVEFHGNFTMSLSCFCRDFRIQDSGAVVLDFEGGL